MKKIIIAAAIICVAAFANAAAVGWTCMGATGYANYSVFVVGINGVTGADQIKSLLAESGLSAISSYEFASGTLNNGSAMALATSSGKSIEWSGSGTDNYTAYVFVTDAKGEKASFSGDASISMDNNSTSKTFSFMNQATAFTSNTFTVATPEPTSGVLLLLGMAGLALKRKRA